MVHPDTQDVPYVSENTTLSIKSVYLQALINAFRVLNPKKNSKTATIFYSTGWSLRNQPKFFQY